MWAMNIRVQFLCLLLLFLGCCQYNDNNSILNMNTSKNPTAIEWEGFIKSLGSTDSELRQRSAEQLIAIGKQSANQRTDISQELIKQGKTICLEKNSSLFSRTSFNKLRAISDILAEMESIEALDMLIDCSDYVENIGGLSPFHSATMPAILKYKEKARQILMKKWYTSSSTIKCNIANALTETGRAEGAEVKSFLKNRIEHESDKVVLECLGISLNHLNRK